MTRCLHTPCWARPGPRRTTSASCAGQAGSRPSPRAKSTSNTKKTACYEKDCLWQIRSPPRPLAGPVNVRCLYYMPTRRRVDLTNLLEATDDILVKAGVLADDCAAVVAGHDGSRVLLDRQRPRVEIEITGMEEIKP